MFRSTKPLIRQLIALIPTLLSAIAVLWFGSGASADLLRYEPFDYAAGDAIQGKTGPNDETWLVAGVTNPTQINLAAGNLLMPAGLPPGIGNSASITGAGAGTGPSVRLGLGQPITSDSVYFSFPLRIDSLEGSNSNIGGFFIALNTVTGSQSTNPNAAGARVQVRIDPSDPTKYDLGIFRNVNPKSGALSWGGPLTVGDTHFIVASYEIVPGSQNDIARLWIDPPAGSLGGPTPPTATLTDNTAGTGSDINIASIILRQSPAPFLTLDELRVGTAWLDVTRAYNIYKWEYVNPHDPSQGKRESGALTVGGSGLRAAPGLNAAGKNLSQAYLSGANLANANFVSTNFADADLSQANLAGANFESANMSGVDLTGAAIGSANFTRDVSRVRGDCFLNFCGYYTTSRGGITTSQLYATADYQAGNLSGINLAGNDLRDANLAGQDLRGANLSLAQLDNADLRDADVRGASFRRQVTVYSDCGKPGVNSCQGRPPLDQGGLTLAQIYSTASYQAHDLSDVDLSNNILPGADFSGQFLANVNFAGAALSGANFSGADIRGAIAPDLTDANTDNLISSAGHVAGLELLDKTLVVRDYDGAPRRSLGPTSITVDERFAMGPSGTLRMLFEADAWDSTISFAVGIPITLDGQLELLFTRGTDPASLVGRSFKLFDWTDVTPSSTFNVSSPYAWNLSNLYTTGEVTLTAVPEPATLVLLIFAAAGLWVRRGRAA